MEAKESFRRQRLKVQAQASSAAHQNRIDIWLPRVSHISQLGLLLLTVGGFYFTVIPLYQKALLDEAIARKEIELKQTLVALDKAYVSVRQIAVQQFIVLSVEKCARTARLLVDPEDHPVKQKSGPKHSSEDVLLSVDVRRCISDAIAEAKAIADLRQVDRTALEVEAGRISNALVTLQARAIRDFDAAPEAVKRNVGQFSLKSDFRSRMLDFLAKHRPAEEIQKQRNELVVVQAQENVSAEYYQALLNEITSVRRLSWPVERSNAQ